MFRKQDYEQAVFHLQQLLERKPGKYPLVLSSNAVNSLSLFGCYTSWKNLGQIQHCLFHTCPWAAQMIIRKMTGLILRPTPIVPSDATRQSCCLSLMNSLTPSLFYTSSRSCPQVSLPPALSPPQVCHPPCSTAPGGHWMPPLLLASVSPAPSFSLQLARK